MEVKSRSNAKTLKPSSEKKKSQQVSVYTEDEKKCLVELKQLYLDTINLDVELQKEIYNLEKSYENKHNEIYDKRFKLLEDFKKKIQGGDTGEQGNLANFWLKVLKSSYTEFISKKDEKILVHLSDVRVKLFNDPVVKFEIQFHFEPNTFFSNRVLTKTYYLNCLPDADDPLTYDGAEIFKCEGCKIDWKQPEMQKEKETGNIPYSSFFDFFNPPALPEDVEDSNYCAVNTALQNDFELGFYLKERVIPKAIMFFTGEIADCETSESESDTDDDEEDEEDEDNSSTNSAAIGIIPN